ncbi:MAG: type IV secretory system conjugative DNA transfer family protein [Bacilli bacterium]
MKMKFRADAKTLIMFIIFCIFLLYLIAIGVVNLNSFANTGLFSGLNPLPAFSKDFIATTLCFFLLALIGIIMGTKNFFIDREKGWGFTTKKKEDKKGYSKWMNEDEMKKAYDIKEITLKDEEYAHAGVPVINNGKKAWVDDGENHTLVIGASGSGKTQCLIHPYIKILAKHGESMIVTDPKGEIYEESANLLKERGYKVLLINFRDPENGNSWNPMSYPYRLYAEGNHDKAQELLEDIANNILIDPNGKADPFWEKAAADYFTGLALGLFEDAKEEEVNLNSINAISTFGEERIGASTYIKEYLKIKGELSNAYISANATAFAPAETKGGIMSIFRTKLRIYTARDKLSEMLSYTDFDIRDVGKEKTAIFIKIHDEKTTYHALATTFVKQVYESLIDVAQKEENNKLKIRTNFVLDEFANMPALRDVESMITASRSRNIRFTFVIQNFSQLTKVYGKDVAETIKGNCGNIIYLITTELSALEEISKLCGDIEPKKDKDGNIKDPIRPLVTVSDLQQMKKFQVLIKRFRNNPFKTNLTPTFNIDYGYQTIKCGYPQRELKPIQIFDVKGFVKNNKPELESMGNPMGGYPPFNMPSMASMQNNQTSSGQKPLSIDDFVKKIDEKIAALEEEEKREQSSSNEIKSKPEIQIIKDEEDTGTPIGKIEPIKIAVKKEKEEKQVIEKPKINIDNDSVIVDDNITDDDFFDDFFDDNDD